MIEMHVSSHIPKLYMYSFHGMQPFVTDKEFCGIRILHVQYHSEV